MAVQVDRQACVAIIIIDPRHQHDLIDELADDLRRLRLGVLIAQRLTECADLVAVVVRHVGMDQHGVVRRVLDPRLGLQFAILKVRHLLFDAARRYAVHQRLHQPVMQSAEARAAAQPRPTALPDRFANRRVDHALEERLPRLIEGLRRRSEAIARAVQAGTAMVERLAAVVRRRSAKRETEAEFWKRVQGASEEFVPVREQVEVQKQTSARGRGR